MNNEAKILHELTLLNVKVSSIDMTAKIIDDWLPRKFVIRFLDIGDTSMTALENTGKLTVSKIGRRKFYSVKSVIDLLKNNIINK